MGWIILVLDKEKQQAFVNNFRNIRVPSNSENSCLTQDVLAS